MKMSQSSGLVASGIALICIGPVPAQQVTGELDSPSATATLSGKQLPPPDPMIGGVINEKTSESNAWSPP